MCSTGVNPSLGDIGREASVGGISFNPTELIMIINTAMVSFTVVNGLPTWARCHIGIVEVGGIKPIAGEIARVM